MALAATVAGGIELPSSIPPAALGEIRDALTFRNLASLHDRSAPKWITMVHELSDRIIVPRGAVHVVRQHLPDLSFIDRRTSGEPLVATHRFDLHDHQTKGCDLLVRNIQGSLTVPCGGGKTAAALAGVAKAGRTALVLVHTMDLVRQWQRACQEQLGIDAGAIGRGKCDIREITIATVQTLNRWPIPKLRALGAKFGIVVVDEGHHIPATTYRNLMPYLPARYRWGLTATPDREDGLTPMMTAALGAELLTVSVAELVEIGRLQWPTVFQVETGREFGAEKHADLLAEIETDEFRNHVIVKTTRAAVASGRRVLVLSLRVNHCDMLAESLKNYGVNAVSFTSKTKGRSRVLDDFRSGKVSVVVATTLADEALDVPEADTLLLTMPQRAQGRTIQRVGRVIRVCEGKHDPVVFDFVDRNRVARQQWYGRSKAYRSAYGRKVLRKVDVMKLLRMGDTWIARNSHN